MLVHGLSPHNPWTTPAVPRIAMLRQPSSAMRRGIAVVGLSCLTKKSLAGTSGARLRPPRPSIDGFGSDPCPCFGRVSMNYPGLGSHGS